MARRIHKGTEYNNINETWQQNERDQVRPDAAGQQEPVSAGRDNLDQTVREEAAEYDNADKEERLLGGDRATLNDEDSGGR